MVKLIGVLYDPLYIKYTLSVLMGTCGTALDSK